MFPSIKKSLAQFLSKKGDFHSKNPVLTQKRSFLNWKLSFLAENRSFEPETTQISEIPTWKFKIYSNFSPLTGIFCIIRCRTESGGSLRIIGSIFVIWGIGTGWVGFSAL